ncbi:MAG: response regulator [Ktedonobacteraceae bacterium]
MRRRRLGLVEDNPNIVEVLTIALGEEYTVTAYGSGAAFLRALFPGPEVAFSYDLALIDLGLPDMSGTDVIAAIRVKARPLPIIVISAAPQQTLAQVASRFPDVPIIRKPFHLDDLLDAVERLMAVPALVEQGDQ